MAECTFVHYNHTYQSSGTLWEGRFRYSLVQSERHLLELHRYIELNPIRAGMVDEPSEYSWLSYACNALGVETDLQTSHPEYLSLGKSKDERLRNYCTLYKAHVDTELLIEIRESVSKGLVIGNKRFTAQIEALTDKRVMARKAGRPQLMM